MQKLLYSLSQLEDDWRAWNAMLPVDGSIRRGYQRFGQYVWNKYDWPDRDTWPELFYSIDPIRAYNMLSLYIIDLGAI